MERSRGNLSSNIYTTLFNLLLYLKATDKTSE